MKWISVPFIRPVTFLIAGILLGIFYPHTIPLLLATGLLVLMMIVFILLSIIKWNDAFVLKGIFTWVITILFGYCIVLLNTASNAPDHILHLQKPFQYYLAQLEKLPVEKALTWKIEVSVLQIKSGNAWKKASGKVLLYYTKTGGTMPYGYGDIILIKGNPLPVQAATNPGEFNYKRYLEYKSIYHQHFVKSEAVRYVGHDNRFSFWHHSFSAREAVRQILNRTIKGKQERAIASALLLGVTDELDHDLYKTYSSAGVVHVLSVSGLHVGILYMIIIFMLKPLSENKAGKWLVVFISLFILWAYAFITGLSPSVLRAVTMFSCIVLAKPQQYQSNIYNTLAFSAFFILLFDPYLIMVAGFQLSYLAVIGIVYLYPGLYSLWEPDRKLWDELWKLISVSIAAQVATFGIIVLYFHQFPTYFLLFNIIVIPFSFVILVVGMALLAVSWNDLLAMLIGYCMEKLIALMNGIVGLVTTLPWNIIDHLYISPLQCFLIGLILIMIILLIRFKKFHYFGMAAFFTTVFALTDWLEYSTGFTKPGIAVYYIPKHTAIDLFDTGKFFFVADSVIMNNTDIIEQHISPNRYLHGMQTLQLAENKGLVREFKGGKIMLWKNKSVMLLTAKNCSLPTLPSLDYLVVSNNAAKDLVTLRQHVKFNKLIIDSSNSFYFADKLQKEAVRLNVAVHSVWHSGAFLERF